MVKIAVLASFNMDLVMSAPRRPGAGETLQGEFAMHLGGKGFNQAVAARRLGAEVIVAGRVGDDEFGRMFLAALDAEGIERRAVEIDPVAGTGVASIIVEPDGTNTIVQAPRANRRVTPEAAAAALSGGASLALMQLENSHDAALAFAEAARANGVTTMLNAAPAASVADTLLAYSDVLVVNEIEASTLLGVASGGDATFNAGRLCERGHRIVAVTMGERGVIAVDDSGRHVALAFEVAVVDTTGAGDAFCAALAVQLGEGMDLRDALRFANAAGALACTLEGAAPSMPHRAPVEELLRIGTTRA